MAKSAMIGKRIIVSVPVVVFCLPHIISFTKQAECAPALVAFSAPNHTLAMRGATVE
jgi:hypothetical protein